MSGLGEMKKYIFLSTILCCFTFTSSGLAQKLSEGEINEKVRQISKTLRCAVCQSESVWESNAELALQMRNIVRERVIAGESGDEIRAYFVSRYGDFILLKPRVSGLNRLIWFGPFLALALCGIYLYWKMRTWTKQAKVMKQELPPMDESEQKRVHDAISAYERGES
jgi:cytochrome c-type biogenesis protein CcmH